MPDLSLVNMKVDRKAKEETLAAEVPKDRPIYPWGLQVSLDEEALDKLGLATLPKVGKPLMLVARVNVTSVSENQHTDDGRGTHKHRSVQLQITDLALGPDEDTTKPKAQDVLYEGQG